MFLGKEVIGNPIVNAENGRQIGQVQDLYLDRDLRSVAGLYVGSEGLLKRTPKWIAAEDVTAISQDTVLVKGDSIVTEALDETRQPWLRRDDLQGRLVDTVGGTKVGRIGDVILNDDAAIVGFSLERVYVRGPVAERRALRRTAVRDVGNEDGSMTINLLEVEQQDVLAVEKTFFGKEEVKLGDETDESRNSPYADTPEPAEYGSQEETSPYIAGEVEVDDETFRSPYISPEPAPEDEEAETYRSSYTTPETKNS